MATKTRHPPSSGPALIRPPRIVTRSRTPRSPRPPPVRAAAASPTGLVISSSRREARTARRTVTRTSPRVAERVGQALLHDPVRLARHDRRHLLDAADLGVHLDAGRPRLVEQPGQVGERALRGAAARVLAQQPEDVVEILQRGTPGLLDRAERPPGELRVGVEQAYGRGRLERGDGERVADRVVQLARQPVALHEQFGPAFEPGQPVGGRGAEQDGREAGEQRADPGAEIADRGQGGQRGGHGPDRVQVQPLPEDRPAELAAGERRLQQEQDRRQSEHDGEPGRAADADVQQPPHRRTAAGPPRAQALRSLLGERHAQEGLGRGARQHAHGRDERHGAGDRDEDEQHQQPVEEGVGRLPRCGAHHAYEGDVDQEVRDEERGAAEQEGPAPVGGDADQRAHHGSHAPILADHRRAPPPPGERGGPAVWGLAVWRCGGITARCYTLHLSPKTLRPAFPRSRSGPAPNISGRVHIRPLKTRSREFLAYPVGVRVHEKPSPHAVGVLCSPSRISRKPVKGP